MEKIARKPFKINTIVTVVALPKPSDRLFKFEREGAYTFECDICSLPLRLYGEAFFDSCADAEAGSSRTLCDRHAAGTEVARQC
jgi:hypothetical protein